MWYRDKPSAHCHAATVCCHDATVHCHTATVNCHARSYHLPHCQANFYAKAAGDCDADLNCETCGCFDFHKDYDEITCNHLSGHWYHFHWKPFHFYVLLPWGPILKAKNLLP